MSQSNYAAVPGTGHRVRFVSGKMRVRVPPAALSAHLRALFLSTRGAMNRKDEEVLGISVFLVIVIVSFVWFYPKQPLTREKTDYVPIQQEIHKHRLKPYTIVSNGSEFRFTDANGNVSEKAFESEHEAAIEMQSHLKNQEMLQNKTWEEVYDY